MTPIQRKFWKFVSMREAMRLNKEQDSIFESTGGYSNDPVLAQFHFCNVNREHDSVTRWIDKNVRRVYLNASLPKLITQLLVCRIFNEPRVLQDILPFRDAKTLRRECRLTERRHGKLLRGAYLMVPHGVGETVVSYFVPAIEEAYRRLVLNCRIRWNKHMYLQDVADELQQCPGVGPFIANQVCADLRYCEPPGSVWVDWGTFVLAGPGTRRGLNRYFGRIIRGPGSRIGGDHKYSEEIRNIREGHVPPVPWMRKTFKDPNNLSNCFCEFDKYQRAQDQIAAGETPSLKRKYHGNPN